MRKRFKLSLSVFMLLEKGDEILLIQRKNTGWMDGYWSIPAGALDGNEPFEQAVIRETKEEVAVLVHPEDIRMVHVMHCNTQGQEWVGVFFATTTWDGTPVVNEPEKHNEVRWQSLHTLPENMIPYVRQAVTCHQQGIPYSSYGWHPDLE